MARAWLIAQTRYTAVGHPPATIHCRQIKTAFIWYYTACKNRMFLSGNAPATVHYCVCTGPIMLPCLCALTTGNVLLKLWLLCMQSLPLLSCTASDCYKLRKHCVQHTSSHGNFECLYMQQQQLRTVKRTVICLQDEHTFASNTVVL